ncbi:MAG: hypothetical protein H6754_02305 [Candidatus Omnitrophica bacterium]|nr:hypothetical protein [Candidatus Omnitrophota bacterium]
MKKISNLHNKKLAVILWSKDKAGEDDVVVYAGKASVVHNKVTVSLKGNANFKILAEWVERIKNVTKDLKTTLLDADYCISLSVGDLPTDTSSDKFIKTGLKWPKSK